MSPIFGSRKTVLHYQKSNFRFFYFLGPDFQTPYFDATAAMTLGASAGFNASENDEIEYNY